MRIILVGIVCASFLILLFTDTKGQKHFQKNSNPPPMNAKPQGGDEELLRSESPENTTTDTGTIKEP